MTMKGSGPTHLGAIDRWDGGFSWMTYPDEAMQRASHALAVDGRVWLVDPVDAADLDEHLEPLGDVTGVVVTLDRHTRDAGTIAHRHDVPIYVSERSSGIADDLRDAEVTVRLFENGLPGTGYEAVRIVDLPGWTEIALFEPDDRTLLVSEALGTADYFLTGGERLGVHPVLRLFPPSELAGLDPERILVGHGSNVTENAPEALSTALSGARKRAPRLFVENVRAFLPV